MATDLTAQVSLIQKKPGVQRAVMFAGNNFEYVQKFTGPDLFRQPRPDELAEDPTMTAAVYDYLHDTWVHVRNGDWVVKGVQDEFYPVSPVVFPLLYNYLGPDDDNGRRRG